MSKLDEIRRLVDGAKLESAPLAQHIQIVNELLTLIKELEDRIAELERCMYDDGK